MNFTIEGIKLSNREEVAVQNVITNCEVGQMVYLEYLSSTPGRAYVMTDDGEEIGYIEIANVETMQLIQNGIIFDGKISKIEGDYGNITYIVDWIINQ